MQLQDSALLRGQVNSEGQLFNYIVTNNPQISIHRKETHNGRMLLGDTRLRRGQ